MTLIEFLKQRLEAQHAKEWEAELDDFPLEHRDGARAALRDTMAYQVSQQGVAMRVAWWALVAELPYFNRAARRKAAEFADHPDYDPDWRP